MILFFSLIFTGCKSDERKTAESVVENFLKLYTQTGLYVLEHNCWPSDRYDFFTLHIQNIYPLISNSKISELSTGLFQSSFIHDIASYYIPIKSFKITNSSESDSVITVYADIIPADESQNRQVSLTFDKDSLTLNKEKTKIKSSKGLLNYVDNKYFLYYPEYFSNSQDKTDFELCVMMKKLNDVHSENKHIYIDRGTIYHKDYEYIEGYSIVENLNDNSFSDLRLKILYYNTEILVNDKDIVGIDVYPIDKKIRNGKNRVFWKLYNSRDAKNFTIAIDYDYGSIRDCTVSKTRLQLGLK